MRRHIAGASVINVGAPIMMTDKNPRQVRAFVKRHIDGLRKKEEKDLKEAGGWGGVPPPAYVRKSHIIVVDKKPTPDSRFGSLPCQSFRV